MSGRRASGRSPKIIERAPSTRNADGVSPVGRASCRSRPIRLTSSMPARHFAASLASGDVRERWPRRAGDTRSVALVVIDPGPILHRDLRRFDDPDIGTGLEHGAESATYRLIE